MEQIADFLPSDMTPDQLRETIEALLEVESHIAQDDPKFGELRTVRRFLGSLLIEAEESARTRIHLVHGNA